MICTGGVFREAELWIFSEGVWHRAEAWVYVSGEWRMGNDEEKYACL